jgi:hypothetical protein
MQAHCTKKHPVVPLARSGIDEAEIAAGSLVDGDEAAAYAGVVPWVVLLHQTERWSQEGQLHNPPEPQNLKPFILAHMLLEPCISTKCAIDLPRFYRR